MHGLTVRWSLEGLPASTSDELAEYVATQSHAKFTGMAGLRFKTWRMVPGRWMEGCYVFTTSEARAAFQADFEAKAADAPISTMVGAPPVLVEPHEVLAVAEGWDGFAVSPTYSRD